MKASPSKRIAKPIRKDRFCSSLNEEELSCPICLELMVRPVITQCGHAACLSCIDSCFLMAITSKEPPKCCVCRASVEFYDYNESCSLRGAVRLCIRRASEEVRSSYQKRMHEVEQSEISRSLLPIQKNQNVDVFDEEEMVWTLGKIMSFQTQASFDSNSCDTIFDTIVNVAVPRASKRTKFYKLSQSSRKIASLGSFCKPSA